LPRVGSEKSGVRRGSREKGEAHDMLQPDSGIAVQDRAKEKGGPGPK